MLHKGAYRLKTLRLAFNQNNSKTIKSNFLPFSNHNLRFSHIKLKEGCFLTYL